MPDTKILVIHPRDDDWMVARDYGSQKIEESKEEPKEKLKEEPKIKRIKS